LNRCYTSGNILTGLKERCKCCDLMMMSYFVMQIVGKSYFEVWLHSSWSDVLLLTSLIVLSFRFLSHTLLYLDYLLMWRFNLFYVLCFKWDTTRVASSRSFSQKEGSWASWELYIKSGSCATSAVSCNEWLQTTLCCVHGLIRVQARK